VTSETRESIPKWVEYETQFAASLLILWREKLERIFIVEKQHINRVFVQGLVDDTVLATSINQAISTEEGSATTTSHQGTGEVSSAEDGASDFEEENAL